MEALATGKDHAEELAAGHGGAVEAQTAQGRWQAEAHKALLVAKRLRTAQSYRADCSVFSALNLDVVRSSSGRGVARASSGSASLRRQRRQQPVYLPGPLDWEKVMLGAFYRKMTSASSSEETAVPGSDLEPFSSDNDAVEEPGAAKLGRQQASSDGSTAAFVDVRKYLLRFRRASPCREPPPTLRIRLTASGGAAARTVMASPVAVGTSAGFNSHDRQAPTPLDLPSTPQPRARQRRSSATPGGADMVLGSPPPLPALFTPGASPPSSLRGARTPQDDLRRVVQSLLNKICPENVLTIAEKIASIQLKDAQQLEIVIELIFKKAITEPHYCETYADLVFSLKAAFPEFQAPDGGKPITFKSSVLNICQNEFEELIATFDANQADEDPEEIRKRRRDRLCANMKFIGHLFLRQLLSAKVVGCVSRELVLCDAASGSMPEEHALECACELLMAIGFTLEAHPSGSAVLREVFSRIQALQSASTPAGKSHYSKRVQFMLQDLLDTRDNGWTKKTFHSSAKTKEEIRLEQQRDLTARSSGRTTSDAELVLAGQTPFYLSMATSP